MTEYNSGQYYYCELCQRLYSDEVMDICIAKIPMQPLPQIIRAMVKESKLCKECEKENEKTKII